MTPRRTQAQAEGRCFLISIALIILSFRSGIFATAAEKTAEVGENVTILCNISASGVWWSFNGRNLTSADERYKQTSETINQVESMLDSRPASRKNHTIDISSVDVKDEGNFTCYNIDPEATIDNIEYSVFLQPVISPKIIDPQTSKIEIKIGGTTELFCLIEVYPIEPYNNLIAWHKVDDDATLIDLKNKTKINVVNATLINVTLAVDTINKKDNGTYLCAESLHQKEKQHELLRKEVALLVLDEPQTSIEFAKAVGAQKIYLNWTVNDGNAPVLKYYVQSMERVTPPSSRFTYYKDTIDGNRTSYVLENFNPNTEYQLKITAQNRIGSGFAFLYPQWIRTLKEDPVFTPEIQITGSTADTMTIDWSLPPPNLAEFIDYYEVTVWDAIDNSSMIKTAIYPQNHRNPPCMFDDLRSSSEYSFQVRSCSELTKLCGPWSKIVNGSTIEGTASEPLNIQATCTHDNISRRNTVQVTWDAPLMPNGKLISYQITLQGSATYRSSGGFKNHTFGPLSKFVDETVHKTTFLNVTSNTNYTVQILAKSKRAGKPATGACTMPVTGPDQIGPSSWSKVQDGDKPPVLKLRMNRTSERNGPICCYRIYLVRINDPSTQLPTFPEDVPVSTYAEVNTADNKVGAYIAEMFTSDQFRYEIFLGDSKRINQDQPDANSLCRKCLEGVPFRRGAKKTATPTKTTTTTELSSEVNAAPDQSRRELLAKSGNLTEQFSKTLDVKRRRRNQETGGDSNPNSLFESSTTAASLIESKVLMDADDGPLDPYSNYTGFVEVIVRNDANEGEDKVIFHYSRYFDTIYPEPPPTYQSYDNINEILSIVIHVLAALVVLVFILLASLCVMHRYYMQHNIQGEEVISLRDSLSRAFCGGRTSNHRHLIGSALAKPADISPISKAELSQAYVNRHRDTDYGFLREYEMLPNRFNDRTTKNSDSKDNSHKNRYPDIKAYDQTRVKLSFSNGIQGSDYINANFVIGYKERKKFICAQGPMDSTITDFWRMIWEQHLEIIVMLTNLEEYNKAKCAKYWPEKVSDSRQFGDITVIFASEQRYSDYVVRNLDVSKRIGNNEDDDEERRQITQYHYLVWKDFMAPEHPHGIIKFIRQINAVYSVQRGPILVHCSAGVGRTGTLVALDSLVQQLEEEGQVSIFNTVCDLRHQRNFLVQSLKQYIFLYRALLDIAQFGNTELQARGLSATVEMLKLKSNDSKETCKLELEFERIKSITDETSKSYAVGSGDENLCKNRSEQVIPFDRNRVILTPIPTRQHSTYINASFMEGYDNSESFIITQDPMENTLGDFWRMISEQGITTLVMLSEIGDGPRKCPRYWADDEIQYDHIIVKYMHSESCPYYTRREFNVTNCKIDDTIKVTQFQYNGWPTVEGEVPEVCRGIIELVDQAQKHHNNEINFSTMSPIAVHCGFGTDRSSIFVAMCILVQQLRTEKKIDICTTTRKLRSQRSMLLDTYAQYEFLHRAIVNYADLHKLSLESPSDC